MKIRIITAFLLVFASISIFAQHSVVTIFSEDGHKFWVILDGVKKTPEPQTSVQLLDLKDDYIRVKVIFEDEKIKDINQTIATKDYDGKHTHSKYVLKTAKAGKMVMRIHSYEPITYEKEITTVIPTQIPQTQDTKFQVKELNNIATDVKVTNPETKENINFNFGVNTSDADNNLGIQLQIETPEENISTQTQISNNQISISNSVDNRANRQTERKHFEKPAAKKPQTTEQQTHYVMPGYSGKIGCPWPMSNENFLNAKHSISSKSFEDSKLTIAKQIVSSNCLLSSQVKEIITIFNFEDTKLEFAKFAFDYVYDISNFYLLNDAFKFSSSIDELDEHIRNRK